MRLRFEGRRALPGIALTVALGGFAAQAQATGLHESVGSTGFYGDTLLPVSQLPGHEILVPVSPLVDASRQAAVEFDCHFATSLGDGGRIPAPKVKFKYLAELVLLDNRTGQFEALLLRTGRSRTAQDGVQIIRVAVPAELLPEGFEEEEVFAWLRVRAVFVGAKKVAGSDLACWQNLALRAGSVQARSEQLGESVSSSGPVELAPEGMSPSATSPAVRTQSDSFTAFGTTGQSRFVLDEPRKAYRMHVLEAAAAVPGIIDPSAQQLLPIGCSLGAFPSVGVKFEHQTYLYLLNNATGEFQTIKLATRRSKTRSSSGYAVFETAIPTAIFADGFESGEVSAWTYSRARFLGTKPVGGSIMSCYFFITPAF